MKSKIDITIERKATCLHLSTLYNGVYYKMMYIDYSVALAKQKFLNYVRDHSKHMSNNTNTL